MCTTDKHNGPHFGVSRPLFLHEDFAETNGCGAHSALLVWEIYLLRGCLGGWVSWSLVVLVQEDGSGILLSVLGGLKRGGVCWIEEEWNLRVQVVWLAWVE
jgi:hypothetical protein